MGEGRKKSVQRRHERDHNGSAKAGKRREERREKGERRAVFLSDHPSITRYPSFRSLARFEGDDSLSLLWPKGPPST